MKREAFGPVFATRGPNVRPQYCQASEIESKCVGFTPSGVTPNGLLNSRVCLFVPQPDS